MGCLLSLYWSQKCDTLQNWQVGETRKGNKQQAPCCGGVGMGFDDRYNQKSSVQQCRQRQQQKHHSAVVVALAAGGNRTANAVRLQDFRGSNERLAVCCLPKVACVADTARHQQIKGDNQPACILQTKQGEKSYNQLDICSMKVATERIQ